MLKLEFNSYKKLIIIMVFLINLFLSVTGCSEKNKTEKYHNNEFGVSISYPENWVIEDTSAEGNLNVLISKEKFDYSKENEATLCLVCVRGSRGVEFIKQMEESIEDNKKIVERKDIKLNKIKAKEIVISNGEESEKDYNLYYVFIEQGEKNCIIFYGAKDNNREYLNMFEDMLNTLEIR